MTTGTVLVDHLMISFSDDGGTVHNLIACQLDASLSVTRSLIPKVCKGTAQSTGNVYGRYKWTLSGSGDFAFDSAYGGVDILDAIRSGTVVTARFTTTEAGDAFYYGQLALTSVTVNSSGPADAFVKFDWSGEGNGDLNKGTVV
jgi:hypothetical protein